MYEVGFVQLKNVHSSIFAAVGSSVCFEKPVTIAEDTGCDTTRLVAPVRYIARDPQRLEVGGTSEQRQTRVVVSLRLTRVAPSHDLDGTEALLVARAHRGKEGVQCSGVLKDEVMTIEVIDGFRVNLFVNSEESGNEGCRDGADLSLVILQGTTAIDPTFVRLRRIDWPAMSYTAVAGLADRDGDTVGIGQSHVVDNVTELSWQIEESEALLLLGFGSGLSFLPRWSFLGGFL